MISYCASANNIDKYRNPRLLSSLRGITLHGCLSRSCAYTVGLKGHEMATISYERHSTEDIGLQQYEFNLRASHLSPIASCVSDIHNMSTLHTLLINVNATFMARVKLESSPRKTNVHIKSTQRLDCQMSKNGRGKMWNVKCDDHHRHRVPRVRERGSGT